MHHRHQADLVFKSYDNEVEFLPVNLVEIKIKVCSIYRPSKYTTESIELFCNQLLCISEFHNVITFGGININLLYGDLKCTQYKNTIENCSHNILNKISLDMA